MFSLVVAATEWSRAAGIVTGEFEAAVLAVVGFVGLVIGVSVGVRVVRRFGRGG